MTHITDEPATVKRYDPCIPADIPGSMCERVDGEYVLYSEIGDLAEKCAALERAGEIQADANSGLRTELLAARAEVARLNALLVICERNAATLTAALEAANVDREAMRNDAGRLDWIEDHSSRESIQRLDGRYEWSVMFRTPIDTTAGNSLRAAIDSASAFITGTAIALALTQEKRGG